MLTECFAENHQTLRLLARKGHHLTGTRAQPPALRVHSTLLPTIATRRRTVLSLLYLANYLAIWLHLHSQIMLIFLSYGVDTEEEEQVATYI
jgi:hypothetical protein